MRLSEKVRNSTGRDTSQTLNKNHSVDTRKHNVKCGQGHFSRLLLFLRNIVLVCALIIIAAAVVDSGGALLTHVIVLSKKSRASKKNQLPSP
jgi:hypothetical protein